MPTDQAELRELLKKTQKVIGPPPDEPKDMPITQDSETGMHQARIPSG